MKKIMASLLIVPALVLTACAGTPAATVTVTASAPAQAPMMDPPQDAYPMSVREEAFYQTLVDQFGTAVVNDKATAVALGKSVCAALNQYGAAGIDMTMQNGVDAGFTPYEAGFIIGASVAAFCPENKGLITGYADQTVY